jgi:hypothetical protein
MPSSLKRKVNKYAAEAAAAQAERKRKKMCEYKKPYQTEFEATKPGQRCYRCPYCHYWHRSGSLARLKAKVERIANQQR